MKKTKDLLKFADKIFNKYASISAENYHQEIENNVKTALANASAQNNLNMMIPFIQMAQRDHVTVSFDITRNDTLGYKKITVSNLVVLPNNNNTADKYQPLYKQVEDYLNKYWEIFPTKKDEMALDYNNFTIHLVYDYRNQQF